MLASANERATKSIQWECKCVACVQEIAKKQFFFPVEKFVQFILMIMRKINNQQYIEILMK
jgi:hypothetical protein